MDWTVCSLVVEDGAPNISVVATQLLESFLQSFNGICPDLRKRVLKGVEWIWGSRFEILKEYLGE